MLNLTGRGWDTLFLTLILCLCPTWAEDFRLDEAGQATTMLEPILSD